MADVATMIKEARERRGLSQTELGEQLGVGQQAVSKWESGSAKPRASRLVQIERILRVPAGSLLVEAGYLEDDSRMVNADWIIVTGDEDVGDDEATPRGPRTITSHWGSDAVLHNKIETLSEKDRAYIEDLVDRLLGD